MSSLIANQVKTNVCFVSIISLLFSLYLFTLNWCNNNYSYNNRHNFSLFCLQPQLFCSHSTSHKNDWIFTDSLPAFSCLFIYARLQSAERSQCRRFAFLPPQKSTVTACMCEFSWLSIPHACCCGVIWKVFDDGLQKGC